jgi:Serine/Threonine/Tyrosine Kinase found in polyvalent proteins
MSTIKYELQNILSGKSEVSYGESIQAITRYLRESVGTSEKTKGNEPNKSEETKKLMDYINSNHLWSCDINFGLFISAGAEQRVFIKNPRKVLKLNDSILEDLHDENVLTAHDILYFIDTVFYIKRDIFWRMNEAL